MLLAYHMFLESRLPLLFNLWYGLSQGSSCNVFRLCMSCHDSASSKDDGSDSLKNDGDHMHVFGVISSTE